MHIFLYGPSGSGKSTVGKLLSQDLNLPYLDLDTEIEKNSGKTIPALITEHGESAFRDAESNILQQCVSGADLVIALGGGALISDENRTLVETNGKVLFLETDISTLSTRLAQDKNQRPLLTDEIETSLKALLKKRQAHYESFPLRVDASGPPELVAQNIQLLLGRYHLQAMEPGYDVLVQEGGLKTLGEMLKSRAVDGPILVVSDMNVAPLYSERVKTSLQAAGYVTNEIAIPDGEEHKTIETISILWRGFLNANLDRKSTIIALGGGVVGDLVGFASATFMRGCGWVAFPTTLLAMVDASLGGKTGFDLPEGKNLVGAFHPPRFVLIDPDVLSTLPERELRAGLAEVVKHGVVSDPELFDLCSQGWDDINNCLPEVVRRGLSVKVKVIEEDPFEEDYRAVLNFGHTVGHAVELVSKFNLLHGEAVAIGMVAETRFAERLSVADQGLSDKLAETLVKLGLPIEIPENLPHSELIRAMKEDKKRSAGVVRFALPVHIGEVKVGIEVDNLNLVLEEEQ
ncbi:MAG: 3-dehydroquinate synthase [Anaerolineales bacterium]|nr:3-dehydroquinate synthase [Anaerolineales bacterium]